MLIVFRYRLSFDAFNIAAIRHFRHCFIFIFCFVFMLLMPLPDAAADCGAMPPPRFRFIVFLPFA